MISLLRTVIIYSLVILCMRLMGKRQIGQLQPYEVVIALMISDLAAIPMEDESVPMMSGIIPILTLLGLQLAISFLVLKNRHIRKFICGSPRILMLNGHIQEKNLRREMYNLDDLTEALRLAGYPNPADVSLVILETGGGISVVPKGAVTTVTPEDIKLAKPDTVCWDIIKDGHLDINNLDLSGLSEKKLMKEIKAAGGGSYKDVFYCNVDNHGKMFIQLKNRIPKSSKS